MRAFSSLLSVLAVLATVPAAANAQTGFNGVITFVNAGSSGKPDTFVQYSKGHKLRFDGFGQGHGAMIVDNDAKVMMIVEPDKKQYMTMTEADAKQMQAMMGPMMERMKKRRGERADASKLDFVNTGKSETVAGVRCQVWHGTYSDDEGEKKEGDACVAPGVGLALADLMDNNPLLSHSGGAAKEQFEQYRQLVGGNKGILKATSVKDGTPHTELEAVKIERTSVADSLFAAPAGYKEIKMGDMMKGFQQPRGATPQ
jgi:hypothetical protein